MTEPKDRELEKYNRDNPVEQGQSLVAPYVGGGVIERALSGPQVSMDGMIGKITSTK